MKKILIAIALCVLSGVPSATFAGPIIRSSEKISVDSTQTLKGDFYGFAPTITVSGRGENDEYIAGGNVTINAGVANDLTIVGGVVQVHGDVGDDLRVVGGDVTLGKTVKGDVVVTGGSLTILSTASVEGDVIFFGEDLVVEGDVNGSVHGKSTNARINSKIGGDISYISTNALTLGDNANVRGSVSYESAHDVVRSQDAQVAGEIHKTDVTPKDPRSSSKIYVLEACVLLFAALSLFLLFRKNVQRMCDATSDHGTLHGLVGLGVFLVLPFMSVVLMVSVLGAFVGVLLLIAYILLMVSSFIVGTIMVGHFAQLLLMRQNYITLGTVVSGVIIFSILGFLPYLGGLFLFAILIVTLGSISMALYHGVRS